jgi:hypothetical protein
MLTGLGVAVAGGVGAAAGAAVLGPEPAGAATAAAIGLDLRDYGAVGDNSTDDGPALQRALDALGAAGGGTLVVPPGKYVLATPSNKSFGNLASAVVIRGLGSSSQFIVKTRTAGRALTLSSLESVLLENLTFVGTPGVTSDGVAAVSLPFVNEAIVRRCAFYGINSSVAGGSVLEASNSDLRIEHCGFRGCSGNAGQGVPVVKCINWMGFSITDSDFIDFGTLNGVYHSKTPLAATYAWVLLGAPTKLNSANAQSAVTVHRVRMDEGALSGFYSSSSGDRVAHIRISGLRVNANANGQGIYVKMADQVTVEDSWIGYQYHRQADAIFLDDAGDVVLRNVRCEQLQNRITATSTTRSLSISRCTYAALVSAAPTTKVAESGVATTPIKWAAANQQTTVGASGPASPLPANPVVYLKVTAADGTILVVPAYRSS